MKFALLTSNGFDLSNQPYIKKSLNERGHEYIIFEDIDSSNIEELIDFDVVWDRSSIIDDIFFQRLYKELQPRKKPILINNPIAIMDSYNKTRSHKKLGKYCPKTLIYDGDNFDEIKDTFKDDKYIVIKKSIGWGGSGVKLLKTSDLCSSIIKDIPVIVQQFINPTAGINRALILYYDNFFKPIAFYTRKPQNSWRTGEGSSSLIERINSTSLMLQFIKNVATEANLYINGIDYISIDDNHYLLEVNSVPRLSTVIEKFSIDASTMCVQMIEEIIEKGEINNDYN